MVRPAVPVMLVSTRFAVIETNLFAGTVEYLECPGVLYLSTDAGISWQRSTLPARIGMSRRWLSTGRICMQGNWRYAFHRQRRDLDYRQCGLTDKPYCVLLQMVRDSTLGAIGCFCLYRQRVELDAVTPTYHEVISLAVREGSVFASTRSASMAGGSMWGAPCIGGQQ